jgi:hypothetical protein
MPSATGAFVSKVESVILSYLSKHSISVSLPHASGSASASVAVATSA